MMVLDDVFHFALRCCNLSSSSLSLRLLFLFLALRFLLVDDERMVIDDKKKKRNSFWFTPFYFLFCLSAASPLCYRYLLSFALFWDDG